MKSLYLDTSAFNYLRQHMPWERFLGYRNELATQGYQLVPSSILFWELLMANDEANPDHLIFSAQRLFGGRMLASPSELLVRYIRNAYPENVVNYDPYSATSIAKNWQTMVSDDLVTFRWNREALVQRTSLLRRISKNLGSILHYPEHPIADDMLAGLANALAVFESCLTDDGFPVPDSRGESLRLTRGVLLVLFLLVVCKQDLPSEEFNEFYEELALDPSQPTAALMTLLEAYPYLLSRGPLLEMGAMLAVQARPEGKRSRGAFLDAYHLVYLPYVDAMFTTDDGFYNVVGLSPHFAKKLRHIKNLAENPAAP